MCFWLQGSFETTKQKIQAEIERPPPKKSSQFQDKEITVHFYVLC